MKILMAGDTHGNLGHSQHLVAQAKKLDCDRVFVLGDWGYWEHTRDGVAFCDKLDLYCNINNIPIYFLDGNHDKTSLLVDSYHDQPDKEGFLQVRPYLRYAGRGHRWMWDGVRFIALGGAYSVDKDWRLGAECVWENGVQANGCRKRHNHKHKPQSLWFAEEEMSDEDMTQILLDTEPVDVMLAHDKPRGSNPRWNRKDFPECLPNQDRLQLAIRTLRPQLYLHGHLHWSYVEDIMSSAVGSEDVITTKVIGLDCDPGAASSDGYDKTKSWWVLDTATVRTPASVDG